MTFRTFCLFCLWLSGTQMGAAQNGPIDRLHPTPPDPLRRYEVLETHEPHNINCQITVLTKRTASRATAFLVSGNVLVTAAHVLQEPLFARIATLTVCVGRHRSGSGSKWLLSKTYERKQLHMLKSRRRDWVFIALPENISASFFQPGEFDSLKAAADSFFVTGYPEDKGYTAMWQKGDLAENIAENSRLLLYPIYTWQGDSGAPVWCSSSGQYYAVGIHSMSNYRNTHLNAGVKLTGGLLLHLRSFISQNKVFLPYHGLDSSAILHHH